MEQMDIHAERPAGDAGQAERGELLVNIAARRNDEIEAAVQTTHVACNHWLAPAARACSNQPYQVGVVEAHYGHTQSVAGTYRRPRGRIGIAGFDHVGLEIDETLRPACHAHREAIALQTG